MASQDIYWPLEQAAEFRRSTAMGCRSLIVESAASRVVRCAFLAIIVAWLGSATAANAIIVPGQSIAGVAPGMSRTQVESKLGTPIQTAALRGEVDRTPAPSARSARTASDGAVTSLSPPSQGRQARSTAKSSGRKISATQSLYPGGILVSYSGRTAISVAATDATQVTRSGVGVGVGEADLAKKLGGEKCQSTTRPVPMGACVIHTRTRGRSQSMQFILSGDPRTVKAVLLIASPESPTRSVRRARGTTPGSRGGRGSIAVNVSVAGVRLGMTPAEVEVKLGPVVESRASTPGPGQSADLVAGLVERLYAGPVAVTFDAGKVASIVTRASGHRTSGTNVGVGSSEADVRRLAGIRCVASAGSKTVLSCEVPVASGPAAGRTAFLLKDGVVGAVGLY